MSKYAENIMGAFKGVWGINRTMYNIINGNESGNAKGTMRFITAIQNGESIIMHEELISYLSSGISLKSYKAYLLKLDRENDSIIFNYFTCDIGPYSSLITNELNNTVEMYRLKFTKAGYNGLNDYVARAEYVCGQDVYNIKFKILSPEKIYAPISDSCDFYISYSIHGPQKHAYIESRYTQYHNEEIIGTMIEVKDDNFVEIDLEEFKMLI